MLKDGAISHTVELVNPKTGEKEPSIVHLDKLTNEILSIPYKDVYVRNKICNIELDIKEVMQLKNGVTLRDREIITKDGRRFKADLRYSIDRRALGLINMTSLKQKENVSQKRQRGSPMLPQRKKCITSPMRRVIPSGSDSGIKFLWMNASRGNILPGTMSR